MTVFLAAPAASPGAEETLSPGELMRRIIAAANADDEVVSIRMELDSGGQVRERTATLYSKKDADGNVMRLVRFHTPDDLARSGILILDKGKEDPAQWLYLPAYHTSRRIAASNRSDTWMGTDFAYEDMSEPNVERYEYRYLDDERIDGVDYKVIEALPSDEKLQKDSGYSKTISWVDPVREVALKTDFYDREGVLAKRLQNSQLETVGGRHRWKVWEMSDLKRGHRTVLTFEERKINQGLDDSLFTVRFLERGR